MVVEDRNVFVQFKILQIRFRNGCHSKKKAGLLNLLTNLAVISGRRSRWEWKWKISITRTVSLWISSITYQCYSMQLDDTLYLTGSGWNFLWIFWLIPGNVRKDFLCFDCTNMTTIRVAWNLSGMGMKLVDLSQFAIDPLWIVIKAHNYKFEITLLGISDY